MCSFIILRNDVNLHNFCMQYLEWILLPESTAVCTKCSVTTYHRQTVVRPHRQCHSNANGSRCDNISHLNCRPWSASAYVVLHRPNRCPRLSPCLRSFSAISTDIWYGSRSFAASGPVSRNLLTLIKRCNGKSRCCISTHQLLHYDSDSTAAVSTRVLASIRLQKLLDEFFTTRVLVKFYFRLQISTSGFNFCKSVDWFVAFVQIWTLQFVP